MPSASSTIPAVSPFQALLDGAVDGAIFDGVGFGQGTRVASKPRALLSGSWDDWGILEEALRQGKGGGLAGWFDYAGNFRFGDFSEWSVEESEFPQGAAPASQPIFQSGMNPQVWASRIQRIHEYIAAGDIYQVNLTHTMTASWEEDPGKFYPCLRQASPAPYSCFVRLGDTVVLSASPECFLEIDGSHIITRPIKGTRPRQAQPEDDEQAARELSTSEKERAELIMITDLERNDLGQVCQYGEVGVTGLCNLESFQHVHHMVSTIEGTLRPGISPLQALRACYPGGSITGAPKKRAREIITELEVGPRGIYTGALGYLGRDGRAVFNMAIRTLVVQGGTATYGTGAGIVADSDPAGEYEETLIKAAGLFAALG